MNIGVIGLGIVGSTVKTGMEKLGYDVISHDIKHETSIDLFDVEVEPKHLHTLKYTLSEPCCLGRGCMWLLLTIMITKLLLQQPP